MGFRKFIRYRVETAKRTFSANPADDWKIDFLPDGILIRHSDFRPFFAKRVSENHVVWSEVERVFAGQTDNLTWDTVWVTFVLRTGEHCSVPETAAGWSQLLEQIPANLPNAMQRQDWLPQVTRTAFAPNITQLYPLPT